jgi:hypothetical protein
MEIKVKIEMQYGNRRIFPVCDKAMLFCSIAGCKSLTEFQIADIKALGYSVVVVHEDEVL